MRLALLAVAGLAGCGLLPARGTPVEVREVGRSPYCNTPGAEARAALLPATQDVVAFQGARGVVLVPAEALALAPHAIVESGLRPTGGYAVSVAPAAALEGERLILTATFTSPAPGSLQTQALSSPCALVQLPAGAYAAVEVRDAAGGVRARGGVWLPSAEPPAPGQVTQ